ncbi:MAG: hypothetical protein AAF438_09945 [Pseudomonadota bacterium]
MRLPRIGLVVFALALLSACQLQPSDPTSQDVTHSSRLVSPGEPLFMSLDHPLSSKVIATVGSRLTSIKVDPDDPRNAILIVPSLTRGSYVVSISDGGVERHRQKLLITRSPSVLLVLRMDEIGLSLVRATPALGVVPVGKKSARTLVARIADANGSVIYTREIPFRATGDYEVHLDNLGRRPNKQAQYFSIKLPMIADVFEVEFQERTSSATTEPKTLGRVQVQL